MNDRTREVFRRVVESYLESGEPVGSRTLMRSMSEKVSAATIRNVMQDLEYLGPSGFAACFSWPHPDPARAADVR